MKISIVALATLTGALCFALDVPPRPTQWVTDSAGLLSADQIAKLNARLEDLEKRTHAQFIVYTMPSLGGEPLEDFTVRAAQAWGIGHRKEDNGLALFVFRDDRKVRVEVGYGLEGTVTDAYASRVIREEIVPRFREGKYAEGIEAGVEALARRIDGAAEPSRRVVAQPADQREHPLVAIAFLALTCLVIVAPFIFIGLLVYAIIRQVRKETRAGGGPLTNLGKRMPNSSRTYSSSSSSSRSSSSSSRSSSSSSFSSGGGSFGGGGASGSW